MKIIKWILSSLLLTVSVFSHAAGGWSGQATVESIYALNENRAIIKLSNFTNPNDCKTTVDGDLIINPTEKKVWYTMFLSAYMSGKKVNVYVSAECDPAHWVDSTFARIGHVKLL